MAYKNLGFRNLVAVLVLGGAMVCFAPQGALAQGSVAMGPGGRTITGSSEFRQYCWQCHGPTGVGNGPVAAALKKKPANLTQLAKNNGGVFPEQEVRDYIDGSKISAAHGTREMPFWGDAFRSRQGAKTGSGGPGLTQQQVDQKINLLVEYVKSIQEK